MDPATGVWEALDPRAEPVLRWLRLASGPDVALLLGAFDPPTLAHVALLRAARRHTGAEGAFCLTKVLFDRPDDELLEPVRRLRLLDRLAAEEGFALAAANRGTYREVARAAASTGLRPVFVVGSDKLAQLEDPRFYSDGRAGVEATFAEARFLVVPRGVPVGRRDVEILPAEAVFDAPSQAAISATRVRRRLASGESVDDLVPPVVALDLPGYTGPSDPA